jgi:hypothetical protein
LAAASQRARLRGSHAIFVTTHEVSWWPAKALRRPRLAAASPLQWRTGTWDPQVPMETINSFPTRCELLAILGRVKTTISLFLALSSH